MNETEEQLEDQPGKTDKMLAIAMRIKAGEAKNPYVYCLEEDRFYIYEDGYWKILFDKQVQFRISQAFPKTNKYSISTRKQIIDNLKILVHKELVDFNSNDLLNFPSGMFDVRGNNLIKHDHELLSTVRLPYRYDMLAKCPLWIKTLEGIFEGDRDKINVLQEFFGYCLTKDVSREKSLLFLGESRSGKSTILETLQRITGEENCSSVALEYLSNPQYTPMLINKMVNIDWDVASGAEKFEANFKIITSGEPVSVNQKFVATFKFRPYCKLVMAANKFPRITDHSSAFYKRLILLPCNRVFEPHEQDIKLKHKLIEELPGIFNWCLEGFNRLEDRGGFEVNKEFMVDAILELREESNPIEIFFKENIVTDVSGNAEIVKSDIYKLYTDWCKINGNVPMSSIKFGQFVYQKYSKFTPKNARGSTGNRPLVWRNLRLINHNIPQGQEIEWQERVSKSTT